MRHKCVMIVAASVLLPISHVRSAPINWGTPADTTGKADLIEGAVVLAVSGGNGATIAGGGAGGSQTYVFTGVSYQDLVFSPAPGLRTSADVSNGAPSTGDTDFDATIRSFTDTQSGITSGTQSIGGLSAGTNYQIQVFFNDQRVNSSSRIMTYGDGESSPQNVNIAAAGTGWGQFAVGTFTAGGATQSLTHIANGFGNVHVNAILVTRPGPPEAPRVPTNLVARGIDTAVVLDWDDNTQYGFSHFVLHRSTTRGGPYAEIATPTASAFTDTGLTNGMPYYYVVSAFNTEGMESALSAEAGGTPQVVAEPPNFLFIITDDQDTYSVGAYRRTEPAEPDDAGNPYVVDTPHMDRLAAEGMLFHQARLMGANSGAVCTPSRTCIMTGKNSWQRTEGVNAAVTFPGIFNRGARSGTNSLPYATYRTCKSGNSYPTANNEFTTVNDATKRGNTDGNGSEWHADHGIDYINHWQANHRPSNKPFLIYLGFSHPHDTRNARTSPDLAGRYHCVNTSNPAGLTLDPDAPPLPHNRLSCTPATYPAHPFDHGHLTVRDEKSVSGIDDYRTEAVVRNEIGRNYACIDWIDRQIGRVLDRLEDPDGDGNPADSVLDNTYIVFTSDHGIAIGRHGLQGKQNLYEHTWRVPYIVRGPGIAPGTETDALIYLHDTFPTFCDLAGIDLPATIDGNDGRSFRTVLEGAAARHRDHLYGLYAGGSKPGIRAVTDGRFKLIKYDVGGNATQVTQLFDLRENPFELLPQHGVTNLATQPAYTLVRQHLEELLMQQRIENADPYAFLGDRTLLRFEDGSAGQVAGVLADRFPFANDGTAFSGNGGALPAFSSEVSGATEFVVGESNALSLDFERDNQNYVRVPDARALDFGDAPFTIEAWVKFETLPTGTNIASRMPVAMKKVIGTGDANLDYMFLAAAGSYGARFSFRNLALHLGSAVVVSGLSINDTGWHHISVALDPVTDTVRFTLDNQVDTRTTTATGTANDGPLVIGAHFNSSGNLDSSFDGLIDEFSITDGFLALDELQPLRDIPDHGPFRVTGLAGGTDGDGFDVGFESDAHFLYDLEWSPTLRPASWTSVRSFIGGAPGTSETTLAGQGVAAATSGFYRVLGYPPARPPSAP